MKKIIVLLMVILISVVSLAGCQNKNENSGKAVKTSNSEESKLKDGVYEVQTKPDMEGYFSKAKLTVKDGKVSDIEWNIMDTKGRVFDEKYEEVFAEDEYKKQCRNDLAGAKTYGPKLVEVQESAKVDAVAGATWANKKFKEVVEMALAKAKK